MFFYQSGVTRPLRSQFVNGNETGDVMHITHLPLALVICPFRPFRNYDQRVIHSALAQSAAVRSPRSGSGLNHSSGVS